MNKLKTIIFLFPFLFVHQVQAQVQEEIYFQSAQEEILLRGMLESSTDTPSQIIVIVAGTGPQSYNHSQLLTDSLLAQGYAVFRYDDRGTGKSKGKFKKSTTADFAADLRGALLYFSNSPIYTEVPLQVIGFGEGGLMALLAAWEGPTPEKMILISTPAMSGELVLFAQTENMLHDQIRFKDESSQETRSYLSRIHRIIREESDPKEQKKQIAAYLKEQDLPKDTDRFMDPHYQYYIDLDPTYILQNFHTTPMLFLYGEQDLYVQPKQNSKRIWRSGNLKVTYETLPHLGHYLQSPGMQEESMSDLGVQKILEYLAGVEE